MTAAGVIDLAETLRGKANDVSPDVDAEVALARKLQSELNACLDRLERGNVPCASVVGAHDRDYDPGRSRVINRVSLCLDFRPVEAG